MHPARSPKGSSRTTYQPIAAKKTPTSKTRRSRGITRSGETPWWRPSRSTIFKALCYASVALVPVILLLWLPMGFQKLKHSNIFQSSPIGGQLTLKQAKAIDFVSSAIFAPFILGILNYVWFFNARTSIADERRGRALGISLYALVEASTTTSGSYDVFKLWTLCSSRSGRLVTLAVLTLLAAFAKSLLSNIIAYEAFLLPVSAAPVQLRLLTGPAMSSYTELQANGSHFNKTLSKTVYDQWNANHDQRKEFILQTTGVLYQVAWQNSTLSLNSSEYVAVNATTADLSALPSSFIGLHDVPAVRGTVECAAHSPSVVDYGYASLYDSSHFKLTFEEWIADIPGDSSVFGGTGSAMNSLDFLAYVGTANTTSMYIGSMAIVGGGYQTDWTKNNTMPVDTPFGTIRANGHNITTNEDGTCGDDRLCAYLVWGIACRIVQQQGLVDLTRSSADEKWTMSSARWDPGIEVRSSILQGLWDTLGKQEFISGKAGLGPAFTPSADKCADPGGHADVDCDFPGPANLNYQTLADNLMYGEMEIQRVAYEVAAMDKSLATSSMYTTVAATRNVQRYRVTYIPALLAGALVCIFLAAVLTAALTLYTTKTISSRTSRIVDSLRLLVDSMSNLQDAKLYTDAKAWSNNELENWAKVFMVRYEVYRNSNEETTPSTVILTRVTKNEEE